jgi:hypothetical protein
MRIFVRVASSRSTWYSSELDSEHIWYRGFEVNLTGGALATGNPDVEPFPSIQQLAAWGSAARSKTREAFPFDFEPLALVGIAYCHDGEVPAPAAALSATAFTGSTARGAWVGWEHPVDLTDALEVVIGASPDGGLPAKPLVAQIVFNVSQSAVDPFVVAATRVLEPLLGQLHWALSAMEHERREHRELATEVDRLQRTLRADAQRPSKLRTVIEASLAAITAIVLSILANRIYDAVPWDLIWNGIHDATHRLGL